MFLPLVKQSLKFSEIYICSYAGVLQKENFFQLVLRNVHKNIGYVYEVS